MNQKGNWVTESERRPFNHDLFYRFAFLGAPQLLVLTIYGGEKAAGGFGRGEADGDSALWGGQRWRKSALTESILLK